MEDLESLEIATNGHQPCEIVADFQNNQTVYLIVVVSLGVVVLLVLSCLGVCCRYKRL
jgi:hypothetical protein